MSAELADNIEASSRIRRVHQTTSSIAPYAAVSDATLESPKRSMSASVATRTPSGAISIELFTSSKRSGEGVPGCAVDSRSHSVLMIESPFEIAR